MHYMVDDLCCIFVACFNTEPIYMKHDTLCNEGEKTDDEKDLA